MHDKFYFQLYVEFIKHTMALRWRKPLKAYLIVTSDTHNNGAINKFPHIQLSMGFRAQFLLSLAQTSMVSSASGQMIRFCLKKALDQLEIALYL